MTKKNAPIKAVIFDVDGVLIDSLAANVAWYRDFLGGHGYEVSEERLVLGHTSSLRSAIAEMTQATQERVDALLELAHDLPGYPHELLRLPEGSADTLEALAGTYTLAIVTSRTREGVEQFFEYSGLGHLFDVVVTYEDSTRHKPDAEPLLLACDRLGVTPGESVYVGDAQTDLECAQAAGARFIAYGGAIAGAVCGVTKFGDLPDMLQVMST